jgi:hypothetical protein
MLGYQPHLSLMRGHEYASVAPGFRRLKLHAARHPDDACPRLLTGSGRAAACTHDTWTGRRKLQHRLHFDAVARAASPGDSGAARPGLNFATAAD